ncbi:MAG: phosphoribosylformylglycinamidine synthase subunit PurQ [Candidatus Cloacimonetes bacterium]|nr:phosphoribosylformylglycinamidine synthase subunit PurQ [Candidatus Cloacimonadota bacterium]
MKYSIIQFPGSNCDHDSFYIPHIRGHKVEMIWHKETNLKDPDIVFLPGGFSYGDYLRAGAIAKFSPIIGEVVKFANRGGYVIGVCNGFQVLTETGLLPGALMMNKHLKFICKHQHIRVENNTTSFTSKAKAGQVLDVPIAHKEGNYYIDEAGLTQLKDNGQIVFRYCDVAGNLSEKSNPNGSKDNIAGLCNIKGNVLGMMPHPERAAEDVVLSGDGAVIFESLEASFQ